MIQMKFRCGQCTQEVTMYHMWEGGEPPRKEAIGVICQECKSRYLNRIWIAESLLREALTLIEIELPAIGKTADLAERIFDLVGDED